jgi:hypothetical protein
MRLPRVRFGVRFSMRWALIGVAYCTIGLYHLSLWTTELRYLSRDHQDLASDYSLRDTKYRAFSADAMKDARAALIPGARMRTMDPHFSRPYSPEELRAYASQRAEDSRRYLRIAAHYAWLKAKYLRAARRPWLTVPPDPPEPK